MAYNFIIYSSKPLSQDFLGGLFHNVWRGPALTLTTCRVPPNLAEAYEASGPNDVYLTFTPRSRIKLKDEHVVSLRKAVLAVKKGCESTAYVPINGGDIGAIRAPMDEHRSFHNFWKNGYGQEDD